MGKFFNKTVAPVIVAALLVAFYAGEGAFLIRMNLPGVVKVIAVIVTVVLTAIIIMVLVERIKEIRSGEEDDLGKY